MFRVPCQVMKNISSWIFKQYCVVPESCCPCSYDGSLGLILAAVTVDCPLPPVHKLSSWLGEAVAAPGSVSRRVHVLWK